MSGRNSRRPGLVEICAFILSFASSDRRKIFHASFSLLKNAVARLVNETRSDVADTN